MDNFTQKGCVRVYFHLVDRMKPVMMKANPMATFTKPLAAPPIEFMMGICDPAT